MISIYAKYRSLICMIAGRHNKDYTQQALNNFKPLKWLILLILKDAQLLEPDVLILDVLFLSLLNSDLSVLIKIMIIIFVVVQSLSYVWLFATPWIAAHQASLSFTIFWSLLKFRPTESVMLSSHLILCHRLLFLPSIFQYEKTKEQSYKPQVITLQVPEPWFCDVATS